MARPVDYSATHSVDWKYLFFLFNVEIEGGNTNAIDMLFVLFDRSQSARNEGCVILIQSTKNTIYFVYVVYLYMCVHACVPLLLHVCSFRFRPIKSLLTLAIA